MGETRSDLKSLSGKPVGMRILGRSNHRREFNIRIDFKGRCLNMRIWIDPLSIGIIGELL